MNLKEAQLLSKCHRPGNAALQDPQVQKAVRIVAADAGSKEALAAQAEFDERHGRLLETIKPEEAFLDKIDDALEKLQQKGFQWNALKQPAFLAVMVAVLVVIGVLVYVYYDSKGNFPGRETVEKMVDAVDHQNGKGLETKNGQAGDLEDWFFSKGFEDFHMLPQLAAMNTTACRVFKQDDHPVALVALENHNALLNIFHMGDFDVQLDPPDRWRVFEQGDWAVAARADGGTGYMLMFKGRQSEMQDFVDALK